MRYLVLSDIHANIEALDAVLHAAAGRYDRVLVLGDLVGYGADPDAVVARVRTLPDLHVIRGNHDKAAVGLLAPDTFNDLAREAIAWTRRILSDRSRAWLAGLPAGPMTIDDLVEVCHGTPYDEDEYLAGRREARRSFAEAHRPVCLFGHTHVPAAFALDAELHDARAVVTARRRLVFDDGRAYLANCGAVGQPRDGDARAAYGILDTGTRSLALLRADYDLRQAQSRIIAAGLPDALAHRLAIGR